MSPSEDQVYYDPYDYEIDADPHPTWKRMRDEAPVYRNDKHDFYALSRFEDVMNASLDAKTFSSAYGTVLELMSEEPGDSPMMIFLDAPQHTQLRKLVSRAFSPRRISHLEQSIRTLAAGYLDPLVGSGGFDYLQDFGAKLPVMVISALLGVPEEDREEIREWTDILLHRDEGETGSKGLHSEASGKIWEYFGRYVEERRTRPKDDMISDLMQAEIALPDGTQRKLENDKLLAFIGLLSGAGNETVAQFLGWACTLLAQNPGERTKLVAITHVSNALGTINPIKESAAKAHEVGAIVVGDGAQGAVHTKVDVQDLGVDFYAFSGHKMCGPTGIGVLYGKAALLEKMQPFQGGGSMILSVSFEKTTYAAIPDKFEAGTPPIAAAIGLGEAVDYLGSVGMDAIASHEDDLLGYATSLLSDINGVRIFGNARNKASVLSFNIKGVHAHDVGTILNDEGVAVRSGHHCAQPLMKRLGVPATVRASLYLYNTSAEIDQLAGAIRRVQKIFA